MWHFCLLCAESAKVKLGKLKSWWRSLRPYLELEYNCKFQSQKVLASTFSFVIYESFSVGFKVQRSRIHLLINKHIHKEITNIITNEVYHLLWYNMINFIINANLIITTFMIIEHDLLKSFNIINSINKIHKI